MKEPDKLICIHAVHTLLDVMECDYAVDLAALLLHAGARRMTCAYAGI